MLWGDSVLALSVTCGDSSPKGRALGKARSFAVLPKPLPLGEVDLRSKDGEGEDAALNHAAAGLHGSLPPLGKGIDKTGSNSIKGRRAIAATKPSQSRIRSTALPRGELFCSAAK